MPKRGIVTSSGSSVFNFFKSLCTVFDSNTTNLQSVQSKGSPCTDPCQYMSIQMFLIITILMELTCYVIVVLLCSSLVISEVEHLFFCLLDISVSPLRKTFLGFKTGRRLPKKEMRRKLTIG